MHKASKPGSGATPFEPSGYRTTIGPEGASNAATARKTADLDRLADEHGDWVKTVALDIGR
jgi:hypothetical protein